MIRIDLMEGRIDERPENIRNDGLRTALWAIRSGSWAPMEPKYGRDSILWMIEEIGGATPRYWPAKT